MEPQANDADFFGTLQEMLSSITLEWALTLGVLAALVAAVIAFCYATQAGVIARATTKEAIRQPIFFLLLGLAAVFLALNSVLPFFALGEDLKMFKDVGLITILFCGLFLAIWTSSTSIADEIEGRTAMTLLSKPINRRQFVVGKYVGILNAVLFLVVPLVLVFISLVYWKVGYDVKEGAKYMGEGEIPVRLSEVLHVLPGALLVFLEIAVMTAVSVAISTRLPMIVNVVTCLAVFVVGHLTPVLVQTVFAKLEFVKFMANLIAVVLPALEVFKTDTAIATGKIIPPVYIGVSAVYSLAFCAAAILLAFILFEDRDLA